MTAWIVRVKVEKPLRRILMELDVVCGMQVDPAKAAGTSEYNGKTYYFCSKGCKTKFDADPKHYVK
jgi:YHS domain-containing protein